MTDATSDVQTPIDPKTTALDPLTPSPPSPGAERYQISRSRPPSSPTSSRKRELQATGQYQSPINVDNIDPGVALQVPFDQTMMVLAPSSPSSPSAERCQTSRSSPPLSSTSNSSPEVQTTGRDEPSTITESIDSGAASRSLNQLEKISSSSSARPSTFSERRLPLIAVILYDHLHNILLVDHRMHNLVRPRAVTALPTKPMYECRMKQGEDLNDAAMDTLHTCLGPLDYYFNMNLHLEVTFLFSMSRDGGAFDESHPDSAVRVFAIKSNVEITETMLAKAWECRKTFCACTKHLSVKAAREVEGYSLMKIEQAHRKVPDRDRKILERFMTECLDMERDGASSRPSPSPSPQCSLSYR